MWKDEKNKRSLEEGGILLPDCLGSQGTTSSFLLVSHLPAYPAEFGFASSYNSMSQFTISFLLSFLNVSFFYRIVTNTDFGAMSDSRGPEF